MGVSRKLLCSSVNISVRTLQRWQLNLTDRRRGPINSPRGFSDLERQSLLNILTDEKYCDLPPNQIVVRLSDEGKYFGSEASMYRLLRSENLLTHRRKSAKPRRHKPLEARATSANQVWSWDITWLPSQIRGQHYKLYMVEDIFSRKIVGWNVHEEETPENSSQLIKK